MAARMKVVGQSATLDPADCRRQRPILFAAHLLCGEKPQTRPNFWPTLED
jgi:hypothetical protein